MRGINKGFGVICGYCDYIQYMAQGQTRMGRKSSPKHRATELQDATPASAHRACINAISKYCGRHALTTYLYCVEGHGMLRSAVDATCVVDAAGCYGVIC